MMKTVLVANALLGIGSAVSLQRELGSKVLVTFDGAPATTFKWETVNDPVMGGQSVSSFAVLPAGADAGLWTGEVKIVPFLHAPGFCTVRTSLPDEVPDVSQFRGGGLELELNLVGGNLTKFQASLETSFKIGPKAGGFQANFKISSAAGWQKVYVPFNSFTEQWRGEKIGGAPSARQLASLTQLGIGADGVAGNFKLEIRSIAAVMSALAVPEIASSDGDPIELVSFVKGSKTDFPWTDLNDPVMGGQSTSTFKKDSERGVGVFDGVCRIVPSLKAPGFCNSEARATPMMKFPIAASTLGGGLQIELANTGNLTQFKVAFGTFFEYNFGSYKADFIAPHSTEMTKVLVPFNHFSNKWSSATGEPLLKCSDDKSVCPTKAALSTIGSVGIWAEGYAGQFHLEIKRISAVPASFFPGH